MRQFYDGSGPSIRALDRDRRPGRDRRKLPDVFDRPAPYIGRSRESDLIALRNRRPSVSDRDRIAFDPEGQFAGFDDGAGVGLARHVDRCGEIDLLAP